MIIALMILGIKKGREAIDDLDMIVDMGMGWAIKNAPNCLLI